MFCIRKTFGGHGHKIKINGFHLIELLITVAIISILTALSWPLYSAHITKERRVEAATQLMNVAGAMEEYHLQHDTYANATLEKLHLAGVVAGGGYRLVIVSAEEEHFLLAAQSLRNDTLCQELTLNSVGERGVVGEGKVTECW